uniref:Uncharacterized protein n=1 Tax=Arundo donax TaxID=35708 RepID=A0A0A9CK59_ARUDO
MPIHQSGSIKYENPPYPGLHTSKHLITFCTESCGKCNHTIYDIQMKDISTHLSGWLPIHICQNSICFIL